MNIKLLSLALGVGIGLAAMAPSAAAADPSDMTDLDCHLDFTLSGWSAIYETATGRGTVKCTNGQTLPVLIDAKGGGITVGAFKINDGSGDFTGVSNIKQVLGSYVMAEADIGASRSARGTVMTKGNVAVALGGTGTGWDIGVGFGAFTLKPAK